MAGISQVYKSLHPHKRGVKRYPVYIPDAAHLTITFDSRSSTKSGVFCLVRYIRPSRRALLLCDSVIVPWTIVWCIHSFTDGGRLGEKTKEKDFVRILKVCHQTKSLKQLLVFKRGWMDHKHRIHDRATAQTTTRFGVPKSTGIHTPAYICYDYA